MTDREDELRLKIEDGDNARRLLNDPWLARFFQEETESLQEEFRDICSIESVNIPERLEEITKIQQDFAAFQRLYDKLTDMAESGARAIEQMKDLHGKQSSLKRRKQQLADAYDATADYSDVKVEPDGNG